MPLDDWEAGELKACPAKNSGGAAVCHLNRQWGRGLGPLSMNPMALCRYVHSNDREDKNVAESVISSAAISEPLRGVYSVVVPSSVVYFCTP
jgi:hypothetical protein